MSNVNAEIKWQGNDNAWFSTNASTVYPANIQIFHTDGRYKFTDGVTTLGALSFLGGSQDLQSVLANGNKTGGSNIVISLGDLINDITGVNYIDIQQADTVEIGTKNGYFFIDASKSDIFHSVKNMFSSPLHEFNNIVKLTGLTASQIVETDASKNLVSAAKGTAYNKDFGTAAGNVLEGNRITQTITNGVTNKAPSEDAVFDALSLKLTQNNFTDITGSCTIVGWASYTTNSIRAVDMGDYYIVTGYIVGTSNSATTTVQMPYTNNGHRQGYSGYGVNNGSSIFTRVLINGASDTIDFKTGAAGNFWAATGTKEITFNLIIEK